MLQAASKVLQLSIAHQYCIGFSPKGFAFSYTLPYTLSINIPADTA